MTTQADSARALRRSLDPLPVGVQEASYPTLPVRTPPVMFTRLLKHVDRCAECPGKPCHVGIVLARIWLAIEEMEERYTWA